MNRARSAPLPGTSIDPRYPDSNGRFMGDTELHSKTLRWLVDALEDRFAAVPDMYVATNLVLYYQESAPKKRRDPDVLVAKGVVGKHLRRSFRVWEEGVVPCTLFEVASRRTSRVDLHEKPTEYAGFGVKEYFIFDPESRYLDPPLQGFRTVKGQPVPMKPAADGSLVSRQLGLRLKPEGAMLRLIDLATGEPVLTRLEAREQEQRRVEELKAELQRLRAQLEERNANGR
jgi:Uma2 family endonuclease